MLRRRRNIFLLSLLLLTILFSAFFYYFKSQVAVIPRLNLVSVSDAEWPLIEDDLELDSLRQALTYNLDYLKRLPGSRIMNYGRQTVVVERIRKAQEALLEFLGKNPESSALNQYLRDNFQLLESLAAAENQAQKEPVLFTGYYVPMLKGSLTADEKYRYPLYRKPDDLVTVDLPRFKLERRVLRLWPWLDRVPFGPRFADLHFPVMRGRLSESGRVVPYYTREEIDYKGKLKGKRLELLWVDDEIDRFFLQIQGSGLVELKSGAWVMVGYSAANGQPYRSIGGWLIRQGLMAREQVSMPSIRAWLQAHPERLKEVFTVNSSYVFFRKLASPEALGCYQTPITGGRSIATDRKVFPGGALALIATEKPVFSQTGDLLEWRRFQRLVLTQDTGGAIKGPYRVDIYCGDDGAAARMAGVMKQSGRLFLLLPK